MLMCRKKYFLQRFHSKFFVKEKKRIGVDPTFADNGNLKGLQSFSL